MAEVVWHVAERMRADLVAYAAPNLAGKRSTAQVFPRSRKGKILSEDVRSMVIRAPHGVRLILCANATDDWEQWPWRCVRMLPGSTMPSPRGEVGLPGVVIPDLDLLDPFHAKRTNPDLQSSYPLVDRLVDGTGWTFGRAGLPSLKAHVRMIRIEPDGAAASRSPGPEAAWAARVLTLAQDRMDERSLSTLRAILEELQT